MTDISHQKARALLQAATDQTLQPEEQPALEAHLKACIECSQYAKELSNLGTDLYRVMHANWDSQQPDINLQGILNPSSAKLFWNYLFGQTGLMGKATVVVALILGYFIIANILGIQTPISGGETATILPTPGEFTPVQPTSPTPSLPATWIDSITIIDSTSQACLTVPVVVYENDTLENIAKQYGITTKTLLEYNKDKIGSISGTLPSGMELNIPLCDNTPARTATTINNAITVAPVNGTIFPTQPQ